MCGGGGFRRGLGDDGVVDGAGDGMCVVFAGRSTAVAGLLFLDKGGCAESLIEHFSTIDLETGSRSVQAERKWLRSMNAQCTDALLRLEMSVEWTAFGRRRVSLILRVSLFDNTAVAQQHENNFFRSATDGRADIGVGRRL
jgi:hypothetical protein